MYSVFIVDDESIVREGLRVKIESSNSSFTLVGEASDGELALSMIQELRPDILITDIKMPFMDGLELSMILKRILPNIRIIILSGHDEFEYAKQAISIGVDDYILKPFTSEDILISLNKVTRKIDQRRNQFTDITALKQELESTTALAREKYFSDLILGTQITTDINKQADLFKFNMNAKNYLVCTCFIHSDNQNLNCLIAARFQLDSIAENSVSAIGFSLSPEKYIFIITGQDKDTLEDEAFALSETARHEISTTGTCSIIIAIGSIVENYFELSQSYQNTEHVYSLCKFSKKNMIFSYSDIQTLAPEPLVLQDRDPLLFHLKYATHNEIDSIIDNYLSLLGNNPTHFTVVASYLLVDVIMAVSKILEDSDKEIQKEFPEILEHNFVARAVEDEATFRKEVKRIFEFVISWRDLQSSSKYGDIILKAKRYIDIHYADLSISLKSVSDHVFLSPNHFSTIFSQECGQTFIEYLTAVRINRAKELLKNTTKKSSDIAYETGFSDPHYFSFIFKKHTGYSPREFRNSIVL